MEITKTCDLSEVLLSICVPTFNRSEYLSFCLDSIIQNIETFRYNNIEIVVCDNNSTDNTQLIVEDCLNKYPFISYYRRKENVGAEKNICEIPKLAKGEFAWIMGDDDYILKGKLHKVVDLLKTNSTDYFLLNKIVENKDLSVVINENFFNINKNETYSGLVDLAKKFGYFSGIGFITTNVFRRNYFCEVDYNPYFDTYYPHCGVFLEGFHNKKCMAISECIVSYRSFNQTEEVHTKWNEITSVYTYKTLNILLKKNIILNNFMREADDFSFSKYGLNMQEFSLTNFKELVLKGYIPQNLDWKNLLDLIKEQPYNELLDFYEALHFFTTSSRGFIDISQQIWSDLFMDVMIRFFKYPDEKYLLDILISLSSLLNYSLLENYLTYLVRISKDDLELLNNIYLNDELKRNIRIALESEINSNIHLNELLVTLNDIDNRCLMRKNKLTNFKEVVVFGAHINGELIEKKLLNKGIITAFYIDNSFEDKGTFSSNKTVMNPKYIGEHKVDWILLGSAYRWKEMKMQLETMGVNNAICYKELF